MNKIITVVIPLFGMIFCGFYIVRIGGIAKEAVKGLVGIVFWLFLPCFIFMKTIGTREHGDLDWRLLTAYYSACLVIFIIAAVGGKLWFGGTARIACLRGLSSISGVVGYMGLPLMVMAFGDAATLPTLMITMADNFIILAGGSLMMEIAAPPTAGVKNNASAVAASALKGVVTNPLIISAFLAIVFIFTEASLPSFLHVFATQMTNATGPLALVALGAALAVHKTQGLSKPDALFLVTLKVLVLPLLVFFSTKYLFGLDDFLVKIATLMAALPIAVNVFILASRYKIYEQEISSAMLLSALAGIGVISGLLIFMD